MVVLMIATVAGLLTACKITPPREPQENTARTYNGEAAHNNQGTNELEEELDDQDQPTEVWRGGPIRGIWDGDTYINNYLNLRFVMPLGWVAATDDEVAELAGLTAEIFETQGQDLPEAFWDMAGTNELIDMMAIDPFTGINVQVVYERLLFPHRRISEANYIRIVINNLAEIGMRAHSIPGTTQIGDYTWHSISTEMDVLGTLMAGRQFINIQDGFVRTLVLSFNAELDPVDMLLARFSSLDTPPPPPPAHDGVLVGVWAWDSDNSYVYIFEADGHGMRGFYPYLDPFNWYTRGENYLSLNFGFWQDNMNYSIAGDILTLDSLDFPGETFSYIRWEGDFIPAEFESIDMTGHPLTGVWEWDGDSDWIYILFEDGTGVRGWPEQRPEFYWYAYDDQLLIGIGDAFERWTFTIQDDMLTLEMPGVSYSYVRGDTVTPEQPPVIGA